MRRAVTNEQEQTSSNLAIVTIVSMRSATLITTNTSIVVRDDVSFAIYFAGLISPCMHVIDMIPLSDSTGPDQHIGRPATVECQCTTRECLKVS